MNYRNFPFLILTAVMLSASFPSYGKKLVTDTAPVHLMPMYGYPGIQKSESQKKADEQFIRTVVANSGTREDASRQFAAEGWRYRSKGDYANAMKRFNQSWLLNPDYYMPYWGFGALLLAQRKATDAAIHYEKALSLINEDGEKPRLLTDAARTYSILGSRAANRTQSDESFEKANTLFSEAIMLDPQYVNAYQAWALSLYGQGNHKKAWEMVKRSRSLGRDLNPKFIDALTRRMPEPK